MKTNEEFYKEDFNRFLEYQKGYLEREPRNVIFLKKVLSELYSNDNSANVLDVACGIGYVSKFLSEAYPSMKFDCVDSNSGLIQAGRSLIENRNIKFYVGDVYKLNKVELKEAYNIVVLWMTLWILDDPIAAVSILWDKVEKGGRLIISSLFHDYDTDIIAQMKDYTIPVRDYQIPFRTYSKSRFIEKLEISGFKAAWHDFRMDVDLQRKSDGSGTHTQELKEGGRIQISGGYLMSWSILVLEKQ